jgi:hypothetical protein
MKAHSANLPMKKSEKLSIPDFFKFYKTHREQVAISSWHINEYESFAMWQIFTKHRGLAINLQ